jgi:hypothetical protein
MQDGATIFGNGQVQLLNFDGFRGWNILTVPVFKRFQGSAELIPWESGQIRVVRVIVDVAPGSMV